MKLRTVEHTIIAVGGTGAAARLCGVVPGAICNWRDRGNIPAEYIRKFEKVLGKRRLTDEVFGILPATEPEPGPPAP